MDSTDPASLVTGAPGTLTSSGRLAGRLLPPLPPTIPSPSPLKPGTLPSPTEDELSLLVAVVDTTDGEWSLLPRKVVALELVAMEVVAMEVVAMEVVAMEVVAMEMGWLGPLTGRVG